MLGAVDPLDPESSRLLSRVGELEKGRVLTGGVTNDEQTQAAINTPPRFYAVISTLRGYSMVYVLMEHTFKLLDENQSWGESVGFPLWLRSALWPLGAQRSCGANGVCFFFVLSGAVAWLPCVESPGALPRALPTEEGLSTYWNKRTSRILPMYFIAIVLMQNIQNYWGYICWDTERAGDAANSVSWWTDWLLSMSLTSTFSSWYFYPAAYGILWAVGPIFWFSVLLFPAFALLLKSDRQRPIDSAALGILVAIVVSSIVRVATKVPSFGLQVDETQGAISDSAFGRMDDFVVGMSSAIFLRERVPLNMAAISLFLGWLAVSTYTYCIAYAIQEGFDYTTNRFTGTWWTWSALMAPMRSIGYSMVMVGLHHVLQPVTMTLPRYLFVTNHVMQAFGSMSYSVYVWHYLALAATFEGSDANDFVGLHANAWRLFFTFFFMVTPLVLLSFFYIERGTIGWYPQANDDLRSLLGHSGTDSWISSLIPETPIAERKRG